MLVVLEPAEASRAVRLGHAVRVFGQTRAPIPAKPPAPVVDEPIEQEG